MSTSDHFVITNAPATARERQRARMRTYLISMALRTACVLGAIVVPGAWKWLLLAGAIALPYIAVVGANEGADAPPTRAAFTPGPTPIASGHDRGQTDDPRACTRT